MAQKPEAATEKRLAFRTKINPGVCYNKRLSGCVLVPGSKRATRVSTHRSTDEFCIYVF